MITIALTWLVRQLINLQQPTWTTDFNTISVRNKARLERKVSRKR